MKEYIQQNKERFFEELFSLLRIPSVSAQADHKADMYLCADRLAGLLQSQAGRRIDMVYVTPALLKKVRSANYLYEGFPASERDGKFRNFCHPSDHYPALVRLKL